MPLITALQSLRLEGELSLSCRRLKLQGERCTVYVVEASDNRGYYTWCDDPQERVVEAYNDPAEAIQAGLLRAARQRTNGDTDG